MTPSADEVRRASIETLPGPVGSRVRASPYLPLPPPECLRRNRTFCGISGTESVQILLNSAGVGYGAGKPGGASGARWRAFAVRLRFFRSIPSTKRFEG